jgi:hypothetical protein
MINPRILEGTSMRVISIVAFAVGTMLAVLAVLALQAWVVFLMFVQPAILGPTMRAIAITIALVGCQFLIPGWSFRRPWAEITCGIAAAIGGFVCGAVWLATSLVTPLVTFGVATGTAALLVPVLMAGHNVARRVTWPVRIIVGAVAIGVGIVVPCRILETHLIDLL